MKRLILAASLLFLVLAGAVACSTPDDTRPNATRCEVARDLPAGSTQRTVQSGGETRSYLLHVPPGYRGTARTPLVVMFHGLGGDPATVVDTTGIADTADRTGTIVVAPLGRGKPSQWDFRGPITDETSDVAFVRDLVKEVKRNSCIDSRRVYAAGFSNGSALTLALACDGSTDFAAYAAVSGPYYEPSCSTAPAASIIYFHGLRDTVVPFDGAETVIGMLPPVNETMLRWTTHDNCPSDSATTTATADVSHFAWKSCRDGSSVDIYTIADGVHGWPGGGPMSPGRTSRTKNSPVNATTLMWEFFQRHSAGGD